MKYARVSKFEFDPKKSDALTKSVSDGLVPLLRSQPGFVRYESAAKDGHGVSLTIFDTEEQAKQGLTRAKAWLDEKKFEWLRTVDAQVAPVSYTSDGGAADVVRTSWELWNARRMDDLAKLAAPGAQMEIGAFGTKMGFREYAENWARAFPDGRIEAKHVAVDGTRVYGEFVGRGTQTGALKAGDSTINPTGRAIDLPFLEVYDVVDGHITGGRVLFDATAFARQLGLPAALQPGAPVKTPGEPAARH